MRIARLGMVAALGLLAAPLALDAQPAGKLYRIGVLEIESQTANAANLAAFLQGLKKAINLETARTLGLTIPPALAPTRDSRRRVS